MGKGGRMRSWVSIIHRWCAPDVPFYNFPSFLCCLGPTPCVSQLASGSLHGQTTHPMVGDQTGAPHHGSASSSSGLVRNIPFEGVSGLVNLNTVVAADVATRVGLATPVAELPKVSIEASQDDVDTAPPPAKRTRTHAVMFRGTPWIEFGGVVPGRRTRLSHGVALLERLLRQLLARRCFPTSSWRLHLRCSASLVVASLWPSLVRAHHL